MSCAFDFTLPNTSYNDIAMIGCNLKQDSAGGTAPSSSSTAGTTESASRARLRSHPDPDSSGKFCAWRRPRLRAWTEFNTECWEGGAGEDYDMSPIQQAMALVPSTEDGTRTAAPSA
jgi:hypothetical protein